MRVSIRSLRVQLPVATVMVVGAVLGASVLVAHRAAGTAAGQAVQRTLEGTRVQVRAALAARERSALATAGALAQSPVIRAAVLFGNPADAREHAMDAADYLGADWVELINGNGERIAGSNDSQNGRQQDAGARGRDAAEPGQHERGRDRLVPQALAGSNAAGYGAQTGGRLLQFVAVPVHDVTLAADGGVIGAMVAAFVLDSEFLAGVREAAGGRVELVGYIVDQTAVPRVAATTLPATDELHTTLATWNPSASEQIGSGGRTDLVFEGTRYVWLGTSLLDADGTPVGGVLVLRSRDAELAPFHAFRRSVLVAGLIGVVLALVVSGVIAQRLAAPAVALGTALHEARRGELDTDLAVRGADELAHATDAARKLLADLADERIVAAWLRHPEHGSARLSYGWGDAQSRTDLARPALDGVLGTRYQLANDAADAPAGVVYRAFDPARNAWVALQHIRPELLSRDAEALAGLRRDVTGAQRIRHRNVVRVNQLEELPGGVFVVTEWWEGARLSELLADGEQLPVGVGLAVVRQVLRALTAAHAAGAWHRSIALHNVLVRPDGVVKVAGFGLGRLGTWVVGTARDGGAVAGAECLAPEQLAGEDGDARSDLFAVGVLAYRCLTGRPPHLVDSPLELVTRTVEEPAAWPADAPRTIPGPIIRTVLSALDRDPLRRPESARELHDALTGAAARG